jgi:hypothetical protein
MEYTTYFLEYNSQHLIYFIFSPPTILISPKYYYLILPYEVYFYYSIGWNDSSSPSPPLPLLLCLSAPYYLTNLLIFSSYLSLLLTMVRNPLSLHNHLLIHMSSLSLLPHDFLLPHSPSISHT